jgi:hypothetical protein
MNLLAASIGTALAYAGDIPRALLCGAIDHAVDRGLQFLASRRPKRVVARADYILRSYLFGRVGKGFPQNTPSTLGGLDATAYLHSICSPDAGRSHHSHPWEWAISIVLAGSYLEEVVGADGTITTRSRHAGSVALISASSFHRICELGAPRVWTLFIVGPRTQDRAWYFRRLDGSIVHERDYHANLEAERRAEEAWIAERAAERVAQISGVVRCCAMNGTVLALVDDDYIDGSIAEVCRPLGVDWTPYSTERQYEARLSAAAEREAEQARAGVAVVKADAEQLMEDWRSRGWVREDASVPTAHASTLRKSQPSEAARILHEALLERGVDGTIISPPESMREAVNAMLALGWRRFRSDRLREPMGTIRASTISLVDTSKPVRGGPPQPTWLHRCDADMLAAVAPVATYGALVIVSDAESTSSDQSILAGEAAEPKALLVGARPGVRTIADRDDFVSLYGEKSWAVRVLDGEVPPVEVVEPSERPPLSADPTAAPEGYTFEPIGGPSVIIRHGDAYVGSLMISGRAVAGGRELPSAEVEQHSAAWAHARAMRRSAEAPKHGHVSFNIGPHGSMRVGPLTEGS